MLITLSRRTAICESVAEFWLTGVAPLGALSHRFDFLFLFVKRAQFVITFKLVFSVLPIQ